MSFNEIVLWVMAFGALAGGLDKILGDRLGLGKEFDKGYETMGPLALGMVGIVCLTPLIQQGVSATIAPLFARFGMDPAVLGAILANDMGGYQLAMELAEDPMAGKLAGCWCPPPWALHWCSISPWAWGSSRRKNSPFSSRDC